jgi:hypothetical protein
MPGYTAKAKGQAAVDFRRSNKKAYPPPKLLLIPSFRIRWLGPPAAAPEQRRIRYLWPTSRTSRYRQQLGENWPNARGAWQEPSWTTRPRSASQLLCGAQGSRLYREPVATPELQTFNARIAGMLADLPTIDGERGLLLPTLDLDPMAKAHWVEIYDAVEAQLSSGGNFAPVRDVASKAPDNVARLAGVLHLFESGPGGVIGLRSMQAAARIVLWHLYAARGLFAPFTLSREAANAATLDRWLIDRCRMEGVDGFSTRAVLNGGPNGTRKREDFDTAIEVLVRHGRVRLVEDGRRRPLVVNPMLVDGTADDADDDGREAPMPRRAGGTHEAPGLH